jgi:hypothetical protein
MIEIIIDNLATIFLGVMIASFMIGLNKIGMDHEKLNFIEPYLYNAEYVIGIVMLIYSGINYIIGNIQISVAMGVMCIAFRVAIRK